MTISFLFSFLFNNSFILGLFWINFFCSFKSFVDDANTHIMSESSMSFINSLSDFAVLFNNSKLLILSALDTSLLNSLLLIISLKFSSLAFISFQIL